MKHSLGKKRVFVAMSGGVDSSVAAALLKKEGYEVTGVFMKVWQPEFLPCTWEDERRDALRVAAHLNIPLLIWDFEKEYKKYVADYMIREYRLGRTPNPDVLCNKEVKFGAFFRRAMSEGADVVATGHYARVANVEKGKQGTEYKLIKGTDESKDQSYFLWTLGQEQLSKTFFPIGKYKKKQVRVLARKFGLPVAEKRDSQGLCFVGKLDMKDFLTRFITEKEGEVLDASGVAIGTHRGAYLYTLGERHGFLITKKTTHDAPYYVVAKDLAANTITVMHHAKKDIPSLRKEVVLSLVSFCRARSDISLPYTAQVRYHGELYVCRTVFRGDDLALEFKKPVMVDAGQSVVLYDGDECVGGGVVKE